MKNNKWFCNWTYIFIRRWLYRRDAADSMVDVPLHVCWLVMQLAIFVKLISLNYTIMTVIPHSYPYGMILWPVSINSSSHILSVKLIKVQWVTWNTLSKSNHCITYERNYRPCNWGNLNSDQAPNIIQLIWIPKKL